MNQILNIDFKKNIDANPSTDNCIQPSSTIVQKNFIFFNILSPSPRFVKRKLLFHEILGKPSAVFRFGTKTTAKQVFS